MMAVDFDLDAGAIGDESGDLDQGHGREGAAHDVAICPADLADARDILLLVEHVPGHARDMLGLGAGSGQHLDRVVERLAHLRHEIVALELLLGVPADLPRDEDQRAAADDAVGIAFGPGPTRRVYRTQRAHRRLLLLHPS